MRAFLAIPIDPRTTQQLNALVAQLKQTDWGERIVWFPPQNYHLTLHFLGG
ncbi:MAG: RNA 2',3'-cyclic phosphodiesterase, partial [Gammaproteobacteria bacterium]|nr:RNA 2',3'-cyclic phosphodiesterase [Gammaproteobacteria bacterium]